MSAEVYGTANDMWTQRALAVLERKRMACTFVDLDVVAGERERLIRDTRRYQTPYVFLHGEFIGGYAELDELDRLGQLEARTIEIVKRETEFVPSALGEK